MKKILISGGSGYVGSHLTALLQSKGYEVTWLTRKPDSNHKIKQYSWDYKQQKIDLDAIITTDIIINLAGTSINGKRWTKKYKKEIYDSRIKSTEFLYRIVSAHLNRIRIFIQSSAVGYYGYSAEDKIFAETDSPGNDFLAKTCADWENAARKFSDLNIKTTIIRSGIVFCPTSEAFKKISMPIRYGLGAALGTGNQYFPWIHLDDICNIYLKAIEDESMQEVYNAVAPEYVTNNEMTKIIAKHFNKPLWLPNISSFLIKIALGEVTDSILYGNRVSSKKIISIGFDFKYKSILSLW